MGRSGYVAYAGLKLSIYLPQPLNPEILKLNHHIWCYNLMYLKGLTIDPEKLLTGSVALQFSLGLISNISSLQTVSEHLAPGAGDAWQLRAPATNLPLLHGTQLQSPAPMWWLRTVHKTSFRSSAGPGTTRSIDSHAGQVSIHEMHVSEHLLLSTAAPHRALIPLKTTQQSTQFLIPWSLFLGSYGYSLFSLFLTQLEGITIYQLNVNFQTSVHLCLVPHNSENKCQESQFESFCDGLGYRPPGKKPINY